MGLSLIVDGVVGGFPGLEIVLNLGAAQTLIIHTIASFGGLLELYSSLLEAWEEQRRLAAWQIQNPIFDKNMIFRSLKGGFARSVNLLPTGWTQPKQDQWSGCRL